MTDGLPVETLRTALSPRPKGRGKSGLFSGISGWKDKMEAGEGIELITGPIARKCKRHVMQECDYIWSLSI